MRQALLFPDEPVESVDTAVAKSRISVLALNLQNPSAERAAALFEYLLSSQANLLVLTELRRGPGADRIASSLESVGFELWFGSDPDKDYFCLVASKGFDAARLTLPSFFLGHRVSAVSLATPFGPVSVLGVYGPSNGMTEESAERRRGFQSEFVQAIKTLQSNDASHILLAGDLNVLEPGHRPRFEAFRDHDYEFYRALAGCGLTDAFRYQHPDRIEHSWIDRNGLGQRLDHAFVSSRLNSSLVDCWYDHAPRLARLSDHSALVFSLGRSDGIVSAP